MNRTGKVSELSVPKINFKNFGLTQTLIKAYRECPRKFLLKINKYRTSTIKKSLLYGGLIHHLLAEVLKSDRFSIDNIDNIDSCLNKWMLDYKKEQDKNYKIDEVLFEELCGMAAAIIPAYIEYYFKDIKRRNWIAIEKQATLNKGYKLLLNSKLDAIYELTKNSFWMVEHKTMGRINGENLIYALSMDFQTQYYDLTSDNLCKGCLYDIIRTPQLRRRQNDSLRDFTKRVGDDISKRPEFYFMQFEIKFNNRSRKIFRAQIEHIVNQIRKAMEKDQFIPNICSCMSKGQACEYLEACAKDDLSVLTKQKYISPELASGGKYNS